VSGEIRTTDEEHTHGNEELGAAYRAATVRRIEEYLATSGLERQSDESLADEVIRLIGASLAHRRLPSVKAFVLGGQVRELLRPAADLDPKLISVELSDGSICRVRSLDGRSLEEGAQAVVVLHTEDGGEVEPGEGGGS